MGFIKAFTGALSGAFADQWRDYYLPQSGVSATAAVFPAVPNSSNAGIGENYKGSSNIITNGSKIYVPEGVALITLENGQITGFIAESGGYEFRSNDPSSRSMLAGDGILSSTIGQSWERFKFGGQPSVQQLAFYVNLKEIPNNKFGTQNEIAFYDNFLGTQVSLMTRGTYSLRIMDPILFVKQFVPVKYLQPGAPAFDFADMDNDASEQLFNEVVGCLGSALSSYTQDEAIQGSLIKVQGDQLGFAKSLSQTVENEYQWKSGRGLEITRVAILGIEYDEETKKLLSETREDDREIRKKARMGQAYSDNLVGMMAADSGQAMTSAAANENGAMVGFMGMNMAQQNVNNVMGTASNIQSQQQTATNSTNDTQVAQNPTDRLLEMKKLLDAGAISQEDYDKVKAQILGF